MFLSHTLQLSMRHKGSAQFLHLVGKMKDGVISKITAGLHCFITSSVCPSLRVLVSFSEHSWSALIWGILLTHIFLSETLLMGEKLPGLYRGVEHCLKRLQHLSFR